MDDLQNRLDALYTFLRALPEVRSLTPYGSFVTGQADEYSDIDLALDVSGIDNGQFLLTLPEVLARRYPVLYTDFAPSLAPEKYILTAAMYPDRPFLLLDISVTAVPHCQSVTGKMLSARNDLYSHTLKLFTANLKHFLRGMDCGSDIRKMYGRLPLPEMDTPPEMLRHTHRWLTENGTPSLREYVNRFTPWIHRL